MHDANHKGSVREYLYMHDANHKGSVREYLCMHDVSHKGSVRENCSGYTLQNGIERRL